MDVLTTLAEQPTREGLGSYIWLFALLVGVLVAMLVSVRLVMRRMRRSVRSRARLTPPTPDPWLESGARVGEGGRDA